MVTSAMPKPYAIALRTVVDALLPNSRLYLIIHQCYLSAVFHGSHDAVTGLARPGEAKTLARSNMYRSYPDIERNVSCNTYYRFEGVTVGLTPAATWCPCVGIGNYLREIMYQKPAKAFRAL